MNNNRGMILIVFPFLLLGILGVSALAIDLGQLGQLQNVVTRAADAGTVAGLKFRAQVGWLEVNTRYSVDGGLQQDDYPILEEAYRATRENLILAGIIPAGRDRTFATVGANNTSNFINIVGKEYRPLGENNDTVRVLIQYRGTTNEAISVIVAVRARLLLANALYDGLGRTTVISNLPVPTQLGPNASDLVPTGELKPVDVQMVLDASNSMSCPLVGDCSCAKTEGGCARASASLAVGVPEFAAARTIRITGRETPVERYFPREQRLRDAALRFTQLFNPFRDRIGIHAFQTSATTLKPIADTSNCARGHVGGVPTYCIKQITRIFQRRDPNSIGLSPAGGTNIIDGFQRSWEDYMASANPNRDVFWVLFSDGAPTAGRFNFANPIRDLRNDPKGTNCPTAVRAGESLPRCLPSNPAATRAQPAGYDYYHYALDWPGVGNSVFSAPGVLIRGGFAPVRATGQRGRTPWLPYGYAQADPRGQPAPLEGRGNPIVPAVPLCSQLSPVTSIANSGVGSLATAELDALGNCINDLSYGVPRSNNQSTIFAANVAPTQYNWKREYYHGAINWADAIRSLATDQRHAAIYTIGLGRSISNSCGFSVASNDLIPDGIVDPYQCLKEKSGPNSAEDFNNFARKDVLLARIAKDVATINSKHLPPFNYLGNPECDASASGCSARSPSWGTPDPQRDGRYIYTSDPESLANRFSFVGRNILLRVLSQ